jgi:hypothetical protein
VYVDTFNRKLFKIFINVNVITQRTVFLPCQVYWEHNLLAHLTAHKILTVNNTFFFAIIDKVFYYCEKEGIIYS